MTTNPAHPYQKVHYFLRHHPMGILSTVDAEGTPWGAAIYFVADEKFRFYFVTKSETYKYGNLEKSPLAALTIADSESQTTVQLTGKVSAVPVQQYVDVFFTKLAGIRPDNDYNWAPPVDKIREGNYMPLCITPTKLQYADYKDYKFEKHARYIEKIIG